MSSKKTQAASTVPGTPDLSPLRDHTDDRRDDPLMGSPRSAAGDSPDTLILPCAVMREHLARQLSIVEDLIESLNSVNPGEHAVLVEDITASFRKLKRILTSRERTTCA